MLLRINSKEYTHKPLRIPRLGGRDPETGHKVNQHVGGGIKWDYFLVDKFRYGPTDGSFYEEKVLEIRKDPNRTSFIALVAGTKAKRWILATENMHVGQIIKTSSYIPPLPIKPPEGDAYPLGALANGMQINSVESYPGGGAHNIVNAGCFATILRRQGDGKVVVQLPNLHEFACKQECMATIGRLSNVDHYKEQLGSPNEARRRGIKQSSGLWRRKDGYCGRKIHPLPPTRTVEGPPDPPLKKVHFTLTKNELSALFGPAACHQMIHSLTQSYPQ